MTNIVKLEPKKPEPSRMDTLMAELNSLHKAGRIVHAHVCIVLTPDEDGCSSASMLYTPDMPIHDLTYFAKRLDMMAEDAIMEGIEFDPDPELDTE